MRTLRAAAVVLPRSTAGGGPGAGVGNGSSSVGSDMVVEPSATPYVQRMGSAPPVVAGSPTYTYPPEVRRGTSAPIRCAPFPFTQIQTHNTYKHIDANPPGILRWRGRWVRLAWLRLPRIPPFAIRRRLPSTIALSPPTGGVRAAAPVVAAADAAARWGRAAALDYVA